MWLLAVLMPALVLCAEEGAMEVEEVIPDIKLLAKRGRFFVYPLEAQDFFDRTVPIKWSASLYARPDLPSWLNLAQSPNHTLAYLYGTPEPKDQNCDVVVLALNQLTFEIVKKIIYIHVRYDNATNDPYLEQNNSRFTIPMAQVAQVWVQNYDAWQLLHQPNIMKDLQDRVRKAFRGPKVRPYVRDIKPAIALGGRVPLNNEKSGFVAFVATRKGFTADVLLFSRGLRMNVDHCKRNDIVPFDRLFAPEFVVDWCQFKVNNATPSRIRDIQSDRAVITPPKWTDGAVSVESGGQDMSADVYEPYSLTKPTRDYFWDWVMVAAVPVAVLLVIILVLSMVLFGCREGQHWRDFKTPQNQLNEYMSVRRGQKMLMDLTVNRQSVLSDDEEETVPALPLGADANSTNHALIRQNTVEQTRTPDTRASSKGPVGKQTVLEAASARGSTVHLYEKDIYSDDSGETGTIKREPKKKPSLVTAV